MRLTLKDGGELYYEVHGGEGPWVTFLNGIMMSTASWAGFLDEMKRDYRLLLMDFRDQGRSSKMSTRYDWKIHVNDLIELFDELSIKTINLLGVSYGGQVGLELTREYQDRLNTLMLVNVTPKVSKYLQAISDSWELAASLGSGRDFFTVAIPSIYSDVFYEQNLDWLKERQEMFEELLTEEWMKGFTRLSKSAKDFDCSDLIEDIHVPTLVLSADRDILTPAGEMKEMAGRIPDSTYLNIPDAGHAAFLEKQREFLSAVKGFLSLNN